MMDGVGHDDDAAKGGVEFLDVGPRGTPAGRAVRRWPKWLPLLLAAIMAALVIVVITHRDSTPSASPTTHPAAPSQSVTSAPNTSSAPSSTPAPITVTEVGHRLLGVTAAWELFGRRDGVLVRIQLARGRISRTTVPGLASSGPVSFLVGPNLAIIRPIDAVPGYVVPDGKAARQISANLSQGKSGPAFPGPDPNHIWVQNVGGVDGMTLAALNGASLSTTLLPIPAGTSSLAAVPDGAGYLLYPAVGGVYDSRPDGLHRISTGALLAVGPTGWLTLDCDTRDRCVTVYIDQASSTRRVVGHELTGSGQPGSGQPGVISPDGTTVALFQAGPGCTSLCLFDLATGAMHPIALPLDQTGDATIVWSPDSRWLFALGTDGKLYALDAHTRRATPLIPARIRLPQLRQLATRTSSAN